MRTPFTALLATSSIAFLLLALFLQSWPLVLLCLFPISLLGLSLATPPPRPHFVVVRTVSRDRALVEQDVGVQVTIRNQGPRLGLAEIEDIVPPGLRIREGTNRLVVAVPEDASVDLSYTVASDTKGMFDLGPLVVRSHDPLGTAFESFSSGETRRIVIAPPLENVRGVRLLPRRTRPWFGQIQSRSIGLGSEFFGVREYAPGDDTRRVNWKASARFDRLFTNEYEGERTSDVVIVLDARSGVGVGPGGEGTSESGVRAALGITSALLSAGNRVGIIVQRALLDWVYPGYGKKQLHRILDALVRVRPGGQWGLDHVAWVLARFFPRNVFVVLISPLLDPGSVSAVASLVARGLDVAVISPSPVEVEWRMHGRKEAFRDAYRILRLERSNAIASLRRNALVLDWDPEIPLAVALKGVERFPRRR